MPRLLHDGALRCPTRCCRRRQAGPKGVAGVPCGVEAGTRCGPLHNPSDALIGQAPRLHLVMAIHSTEDRSLLDGGRLAPCPECPDWAGLGMLSPGDTNLSATRLLISLAAAHPNP